MKKVVITGAKGGTGVSIVRLFQQAGYRPYGVDLKPCGHWEEDYCQLDLENGAGVHDVFVGAYAVIHFGSLPTDEWTAWETAYRNLVLGGLNVLQAAKNVGIKRIVMASSPMIYAPYAAQEYLPIDEDSEQAPASIYGAAKQNLENLARNYARWEGMAIACLRPQRIVYEGSYEWRFRKFTQDDSAAASNLWAYVDARDVAAACLAWIEADRQGFEAFGVAADDVCVATPTDELLRQYYPATTLRREINGNKGLINCQKLKTMLGWQPKYDWRTIAEEVEENDSSPESHLQQSVF